MTLETVHLAASQEFFFFFFCDSHFCVGWTNLRTPSCLAASIPAASAFAEPIGAIEDAEHATMSVIALAVMLLLHCFSLLGMNPFASDELLSILLRTHTSYAFLMHPHMSVPRISLVLFLGNYSG